MARPDDRHLFDAVIHAQTDRKLIALCRELYSSEGWSAHVERVTTTIGRPPLVRRLLVADLSAASVAAWFGALKREVVLDVPIAQAVRDWRPGEPWRPELIHELLHASDVLPLRARLARPGWWPGIARREAERVLAEGATDQLTVVCCDLPKLGHLPFGNHVGAYNGECMTTGAVLLAITDREAFEPLLRELARQPAGTRLPWAARSLGVPVGKLKREIVKINSRSWTPSKFVDAVTTMRALRAVHG